jgi:ubiquinone/menaquinone biosynthesis C-methylase UbiE
MFHYLRKIPELNYTQTKQKIRRHFDSAVATLDVGCGTAEFCRCFAPAIYLGVDISSKYLLFAKRRCPEYAFVLASGDALGVKSRSFSQVLINGVIHHLDDQLARQLLEEAHRVLEDDGKLLMIEDIESDSSTLVTRLIHSMDMGDHIREREGYSRLISGLFEVTESYSYYSGYCHYGLWLLRKQQPPVS